MSGGVGFVSWRCCCGEVVEVVRWGLCGGGSVVGSPLTLVAELSPLSETNDFIPRVAGPSGHSCDMTVFKVLESLGLVLIPSLFLFYNTTSTLTPPKLT